ncbi:concanavalin A-like lectin/glucanase domain-containing protein [Dactylonectria estremocensis]|uniref:Crh-like protein n=1 Tax=Dactylonectria estremocensis TaxID=1079267 RepID=A0A9P9ETL6_9HYPO|nr:concanavalin A-like lectin/glucanase domain-containing protein [Dactylonectria estremocensis]
MLRSLALAAFIGIGSVAAADEVVCNNNSKCPKSAPCCSTYGACGVGAYCLGGCDPKSSFSLDSCVPAPVCEDRTMKMNSLDRVADIGDYLGDASDADWVAQGEPLIFNNNLLLTMPKDSVGTVLSSTVYMWYGNVKAKFKTSRGAGVVTAFILFSDVKDEIDYEFVGVDLDTAQTNFYFQGIPDYENSANISVSDTFNTFHEYEVRWTPEKIEWLIDGEVGRTQNKADTWNATTKNFDFPQTPARVQLSLWPGGLASNAKGTVDWAGGEINWDHSDIKNYGYYFATVSEVEIECYNADSPPGTNKNKSYYYNDYAGTNNTVIDSDKDHILASLQGTGTDMDKGKKSTSKASKTTSAKSTKTSSSDGEEETETEISSIPGGDTNSAGDDHSGESDSNSSGSDSTSDDSSSSDSSSSDSSASSNQADTSNCDTSSFNQECGSNDDSSSSESNSDSSSNNGKSGSTKTSASALAIIIAGGALFWL